MIAFLKRNEEFGFYITSTIPRFIRKIETRFDGRIRAMHDGDAPADDLTPLSGLCRIVKYLPDEGTPYTSLIDFTSKFLPGIINTALDRSFQFASQILIARESDQSVLVSALPELKGETRVPPAYLK